MRDRDTEAETERGRQRQRERQTETETETETDRQTDRDRGRGRRKKVWRGVEVVERHGNCHSYPCITINVLAATAVTFPNLPGSVLYPET